MTADSLTTASAVPDDDRGPEQPACALCGATDINFVCAAAAGWRLVLGRLACAFCAGRFPAWMRRQF
jgi:hypothetical protein